MSGPQTRVVQALNRASGLVSAEDGALGDITSYVDSDGEETDDQEHACVAIVKWRDCNYWSAVDLSAFEMQRVH